MSTDSARSVAAAADAAVSYSPFPPPTSYDFNVCSTIVYLI
jgi:hypothetical protein